MMLRFFASVIGCVAMLSGGLMGWVRYAQHDPEYSCLSFDNITVQLDGSLFMRRGLHYGLNGNLGHIDGVLATGDQRFILAQEMIYFPVTFSNPLKANYSADQNRATNIFWITLYDRYLGKRYLVRTDVAQSDLTYGASWARKSNHIAFVWMDLQQNVHLDIVNTQGQILANYPLDSMADIIGWSKDERYILLYVDPEHSNSSTYSIITVDTHNPTVSTVTIPSEIQFIGDPPLPRVSIHNTFLAYRSDSNLYMLNFETQVLASYHTPSQLISDFPPSFSPNGQYFFQTYRQDGPYHGMERLEIFQITGNSFNLIGYLAWVEGEKAIIYSWSPDSQYILFAENNVNGIHNFNRFNVLTQSTENIIPEFGQGSLISVSQGTAYFFHTREGDHSVLELFDGRGSFQKTILRTENMLKLISVGHPYLIVEAYQNDTQPPDQVYMIGVDGSIKKASISSVNGSIIPTSGWWPISYGSDYTVSVHLSDNTATFIVYSFVTGEIQPFQIENTFLDYVYVLMETSPELQDWYVTVSSQNNTRFYYVSLREKIFQEVASVPYNNIDYRWSPDWARLAVMRPIQPNSNIKTLEIIDTTNGESYTIGNFPITNLPMLNWTQCTY